LSVTSPGSSTAGVAKRICTIFYIHANAYALISKKLKNELSCSSYRVSVLLSVHSYWSLVVLCHSVVVVFDCRSSLSFDVRWLPCVGYWASFVKCRFANFD
jgi:hypothetical protein